MPFPSLSPEILRALHDLRVTPTADLTETAWRAALAVDRRRDSLPSNELGASKAFCIALLRGDLDRATERAPWVYDPAGTMDAALNALQPKAMAVAA